MSKVLNNLVRDNVTINLLLLFQLIAFVVTSAFLYLKHPFWPVPALFGGLIAWLPNVFFVLFTQHTLTSTPISSAISWSFTFAWVSKIVITIISLIVAILVFKTEFVPLGLGFLSVVIMQFLAPIVVSLFRH